MGSHANGPAEPDALSRAALDGIRRLVQRLRLSTRAAERAVGISAAQLFVLQKLSEGPALSMSELAARTLTHQSSVSVVVARLAERKLVARVRSRTDRRQVLVALTARGRAVVARAPDAAQDQLIAGLQRLDLADRRALARGLAHLVQALGGDGGGP